MNNIYAIQARVRSSAVNTDRVVYFKLTASYPLVSVEQLKLEFVESAASATYFENLLKAQEVFSHFVAESTKESNGKTMFEPPFSVLVGGVHARRTVQVKLELVSITGHTLADSVISILNTTNLVGEEFSNGQPCRVWLQQHVNLQLDDNKVAGYNVNPPEMQAGDTYRLTRIDVAENRVIHEAWNAAGQVVVYTCTKEGNLLHAVRPNTAAHMRQASPEYLG